MRRLWMGACVAALAYAVLGCPGGDEASSDAGPADAVLRRYSARLSDLQSRRRAQSVTLPRQICMYLARRVTNLFAPPSPVPFEVDGNERFLEDGLIHRTKRGDLVRSLGGSEQCALVESLPILAHLASAVDVPSI